MNDVKSGLIAIITAGSVMAVVSMNARSQVQHLQREVMETRAAISDLNLTSSAVSERLRRATEQEMADATP